MTELKHAQKYLDLTKVRVFYNQSSDSCEMSGKTPAGTPFKTVLLPGSDLDILIREEMKAVGIIYPEPAVDEGLPIVATLNYSEEPVESTGIPPEEQKPDVVLNAFEITEPTEKLSIPIGIVKGAGGGELSFQKVDFFTKEKGNIFVSAVEGPSKSYFVENIENHMEMFSPESEIIVFNAMRTKPDLSQTPRRIVYNNSLEFLSRLRQVSDLYKRSHEQERHIMIVLHNLMEVLSRPSEEMSTTQERVEKAVRAEILDLVTKITDYNSTTENLNTTFVITSADTELQRYTSILTRSSTIVRFGNSPVRLSKALFGRKAANVSEAVPGRGYVLSGSRLMPFQAFFPVGEMDDEKANRNFRERFNF